MGRVVRVATQIVVVLAIAEAVFAQTLRGIVVDQTGLPMPGVTVQLFDESAIVGSIETAPDGTFSIDESLPGTTIGFSLDGFEPLRIARIDAARVVMSIARATESATVEAPALADSSPTAPLLGTTLTATNIARLPSSRMRARESLPLLPSVVRGPDGLMRLGGAQAHETPLLLDGFNITDPATGISSLNLPFEAVHSIDVLRDPMSVNYGGLLGGLVNMESTPGGDQLKTGVQGFIPRPRFATPGFGHLEGIFPRAYASGSLASGRVRFFTGAEYDYERIPVPDVTSHNGPDVVEDSAIVFNRVDAQLTSRHAVTLEVFAFPSRTRSFGLSPRRDATATANLSARDLFAGLTHRFVASAANVLTVQIAALAHREGLTPNGSGLAELTPEGWHNNWFASSQRTTARYSAVVAWERIVATRGGTHDVIVRGEASSIQLRSSRSDNPIVVVDEIGRMVRRIDAIVSPIGRAHDRPGALAVRDVWHAGRLQIDGGVRADYSQYGGAVPSARTGIRYEINKAATTVLKAGYGTFIGTLPLAVPAYGDSAPLSERRFDPTSGGFRTMTFVPTVGELALPRATAMTVGIERQLKPGLDAQVSVTDRQSSRLATLRVPDGGGRLVAESTGVASYRELQLSVRRTWANEQQLFVSYVRSSSRGELNDFSASFRTLTPLLQPGGISRLSNDAPNRLLAWGTFNLPRRVVVSPVTEWRSGFPFSALDDRYLYVGAPNGRRYPSFFSTDLVVYKTVTVKARTADVGIQLFNLTNHRNPRDVYAVVATPRYGQFTNSVGPIMRGYMLLKW